MDNEQIDPQEAAREILANRRSVRLASRYAGHRRGVRSSVRRCGRCAPKGCAAPLGKDIDYLGASLPALADFPDSKALLSVHRDLAVFEKLKQVVDRKEVPGLADSNEETLTVQ